MDTRTDQQGDDGAGIKSQVLHDLRPAIGSDPQRAAVDLLGQNGEDLDEERHGADVIVVPEEAETRTGQSPLGTGPGFR